jgi:hypothetical protein
MSTKTLRKRISLVAVSALGAGLLSIVSAPVASAADRTAAIDAISVATPVGARLSTDVYMPVTLTDTGAALDTTDTVNLAVAFLTDGGKPASSSADLDVANASGAESGDTETVTMTKGEYIRFSDYDGTDASSVTLKYGIMINADLAGTYKGVVWAEADGDGVLEAGEVSSQWTINVSGAVASYTVTKVSAGTAADKVSADDSSGNAFSIDGGTILKIVPKDSAGAVVKLNSQESINLTSSDSSFEFFLISDTSRGTAKTSLAYTNQETDGSFYVVVLADGGATETSTITVSGGGATSSSVAATIAVTSNLTDATDFTAATDYSEVTSGLSVTAGADDSDATMSTGASSITLKVTGAGDSTISAIQVTDTDGLLTGKDAAEFSTTATASTAGVVYFTLSLARAAKVGESFTVALQDDDDGSLLTVTFAAPTTYTVTNVSDSFRAATGSSVTVTAQVTDQFGNAVSGVTVSFSATGRNTTTSATNKLSDAEGYVSWAITDAGTTGSTDTITVDLASGTDDSASITWVADLGVSTVVLTGGNTSAGVTATTKTNKDIDASADGASTTTHSVSATVKDANGVVLVGVPVTWTISGTGAAVLSTKKTTYTSSTGVASTEVYGWVAGDYTVTATAGGKSGTASITFAQTTATEARTISATADGSIVVATVKDRYGNPVSGVEVYATKTGAGYFGTGVTKTHTSTDAAGQAEFAVAGGSATVTVSVIDYAAAAGTTYGQTCAAKGYADCSTTAPTAFTASSAGTATVAEDGVGASYDAAGVSSASVEVNVSANTDTIDAANEATDAANAATDAANAAAEAADAATAAAQDAQAAVAELATKVASLIAGIKAQITTLTNLVIKIQKKVKA